ncbi:hypothetical protein O1L60_44550 [Streptomyces diastatochromogenes]|nr:hypothetical protein [Streptomyces diastatochromogenes]
MYPSGPQEQGGDLLGTEQVAALGGLGDRGERFRLEVARCAPPGLVG